MECRSDGSNGCSSIFCLYNESHVDGGVVQASEGRGPDFCLSCCERRVKACICKRYASGNVHHGGRRVACLGSVATVGVGVEGLVVYMTQNGGRGAIAPISTLSVWSWGRVSKSVTASLVVASAKSLPRMFVCALIFQRVVEKPLSRRFSRRCEMLCRSSMWWW